MRADVLRGGVGGGVLRECYDMVDNERVSYEWVNRWDGMGQGSIMVS